MNIEEAISLKDKLDSIPIEYREKENLGFERLFVIPLIISDLKKEDFLIGLWTKNEQIIKLSAEEEYMLVGLTRVHINDFIIYRNQEAFKSIIEKYDL